MKRDEKREGERGRGREREGEGGRGREREGEGGRGRVRVGEQRGAFDIMTNVQATIPCHPGKQMNKKKNFQKMVR